MRVIITGASGRMGRMLVRAVNDLEGAELVGATERSESEFLGKDAGELAGVGHLGVAISDDLSSLSKADVLSTSLLLQPVWCMHGLLLNTALPW